MWHLRLSVKGTIKLLLWLRELKYESMYASFYPAVAGHFLVKIFICLCVLNLAWKDVASCGLLLWCCPAYMLFLVVGGSGGLYRRNAVYSWLENVGCGKLHGNPRGFQYHIRACPRSTSNLCRFLSSLTVERVRVFWVFLVRKGPNLFVSVSVQKLSSGKGNVRVQVFPALFSCSFWLRCPKLREALVRTLPGIAVVAH